MFFHTFSLTRYLLYSFQELQVTLPLLLNKKFYSAGLELLMFFAVVKSTANRDDRDRGRGRGLAVAVRGRGPSRSKFGPRYYLWDYVLIVRTKF